MIPNTLRILEPIFTHDTVLLILKLADKTGKGPVVRTPTAHMVGDSVTEKDLVQSVLPRSVYEFFNVRMQWWSSGIVGLVLTLP